MKFKKYPIQIWFLSENLQESATFLTNEYLTKSIVGCINSLITARFYFIGIRNKKFYQYYFDKSRRRETIEKWFPGWPIKSNPPFQSYTSRTSKWCRQCKEHYIYIQTYLDILLLEHNSRNISNKSYQLIADWIKFDAPDIPIPEAHLTKINVPWKVLNPKFRRKIIIDGYRLQYLSLFESFNDILDKYGKSKINVPDFILKFHQLDTL